MSTVVRFEEKLDVFQNIVVLYRDESGKLFIGNTCFYNGRGHAEDWMTFMYEEALPEENGILLGWNWLDDNSPHVTLVPKIKQQLGGKDYGKTAETKAEKLGMDCTGGIARCLRRSVLPEKPSEGGTERSGGFC